MSMIRIEDLTFSYPTSWDDVFDHVSFQVDTDWKLGFVGRNGRGKTTLLELLMGKHEYSGKIISVDHILSLNRAGVEIQSGNFSSWMANFEMQQEFEQAQNDRLG